MDDPTERGYTFVELVYIRLIRMLRDQNIPLVNAVKAVQQLEAQYGPPGPAWATVHIFAQGRDVYVHSTDEWEVTVATMGGQKVASYLFGIEFERLRDRADALLVPIDFQPFVEINPAIRSGLPVIRGTTIETNLIYRLRANHVPYRRIHDYYPNLTYPQIKAAIRYEGFLDAEVA